MACERCADIHVAQREGKNKEKCYCDCHCKDLSIGTCSCGTSSNTLVCPIHGFTLNLNTDFTGLDLAPVLDDCCNDTGNAIDYTTNKGDTSD